MSRRTNVASNVVVKTGEDDTAVLKVRRLALLHDHLLDVLGDGRRELPLGHLAILLAGGAGRGTESMDLEVRVRRQQLNKPVVSYRQSNPSSPLADGAGGTKDADIDGIAGHFWERLLFLGRGEKAGQDRQGLKPERWMVTGEPRSKRRSDQSESKITTRLSSGE